MDAERQKKSMSAHPLYHSTIDKPLQKDKKVSKYAELKVCQVLHSFCTYWDYSLQDIVDRHDDNIAILQEALKKSRVRSLQLLAVLGVLLVIITASLSGALVQKAVQITKIKEEEIDGKIKNLEDRNKNFEDSLKCVETLALAKTEIPDKTSEAEGPVFKGYQWVWEISAVYQILSSLGICGRRAFQWSPMTTPSTPPLF